MDGMIMRIFYILDKFPSQTENFILREILALKKLGVNIRICALKKPADGPVHPDALPLMEDVIYVKDLSIKRKFLAVAGNFFRHPALFVILLFSLFHDMLFSFRFMCQRLRGAVNAMAFADLAGAKADHVHAHFAYVTADVARILAELNGCKWSVSAHAWDIFTQARGIIARRIEGADRIFVCSMNGKDVLEKLNLRNERIVLMHHGVDTAKFEMEDQIGEPITKNRMRQVEDSGPASGIGMRPSIITPVSGVEGHACHDRFLRFAITSGHIIAVGRLEEKKGFEILLKACKILAEQNIAPRCIIVGEGPQRQMLEAEISEFGLKNVELAGAMDFDKVKMLMAESSMLVHSGRITENGDHDGIPNVLLEAMALAKPVIATSVGGVSELIGNGVNGILVKSDDPDELAESIKALLNDKGFAGRIGKAAKEHIKGHFEISETVQPLFKYFMA
ncbi:MAG: hypothetical protein A2X45_24515 [Lentisphaerae bacterium GWF2_50_93]|nr:MAG: hypothetical protein A2X45_24515 [Lentisphaerae bacterium GWF2_50_93]